MQLAVQGSRWEDGMQLGNGFYHFMERKKTGELRLKYDVNLPSRTSDINCNCPEEGILSALVSSFQFEMHSRELSVKHGAN